MEFSQQLAAGQARIEEALAACVQRFPAHGQLKEAMGYSPLPVLWKWSIPIP